MSEEGELRESTTLGLIRGPKGATIAQRQRYTRHAARGQRTLCGVDLGMAILDPPGWNPGEAVPCRQKACRAGLAELQSQRERST